VSQKIIILKENTTKLTVFEEYMSIKNIYDDLIISFSHIKMVYLNKSIEVDIATCYEISKKVPLFIIDHNGYIIAELKRLQDA